MRLGIEIEQINKQTPQELLGVKIARGKFGTAVKYVESKVYRIRNHSDQDREVTLEHQLLPDWKLVGEGNPVEGTKDLYRFRLRLPAGRTAEQQVVEQSTPTHWNDLTSLTDEQIAAFRASPAVSAAVKAALREIAERRSLLAQLAGEEVAGNERLKAITDEQARLRANIDKVPRESEAYKRYLEKFDKQETEIEQLQAKVGENKQRQQKLKKEYDEYLKGLSAE
jgi:chromosome segregation ATPase